MMTVEKMNYSKSLKELLSEFVEVDSDLQVTGVAIDSREVKPGDLFMAYRGSEHSGIDFISDAIRSGATAIAIDEDETVTSENIPLITIGIKNLRKKAGYIISRFYDDPSENIQVIGVTGTNGKTTVSYMIAHALYTLEKKTALIGTLGYGQYRNIESGHTTTPDPVKLHSLFSSWKGSVDTVAMEVSSHALDQGRTEGTRFDIAVFTNLSRDHLDYHETLENYAAAKYQLFNSTGLKHAVINIDDEYGIKLINKLTDNLDIVVYSTVLKQIDNTNKHISFVYAESIETNELVTHLSIQSSWGHARIQTSLLGKFNLENILAAFSVLCVSGVSIDKAAKSLSSFMGIPGRMEYFLSENKPMVVVDYAHTPDALEKALLTLRPYCNGQLHCVFGCGGDRDVGKRAQMGAIAEAFSDQIVLTDDNPRSERPEKIIEDILEGIKDKADVSIRHDRSDAITNTFINASKDDVILIAGKGHEITQEIGDQVLPFSDRELARRLTEGNK